MRKSCGSITVLILLLHFNVEPLVAVNINNSFQITKKDWLLGASFQTDTIPDEDPYGLKMEREKRSRQTNAAFRPKGYSSYLDRELESYYDFEDPAQPKVIQEAQIEVYNENAKLKVIEEEYNGYKVEIANSPDQLPETDVIFTQHGNISFHQRADGSFSYYLGDFDNEVDAFEFYNVILKERYPLARVAKFEEGRRIW